MATEDTEHQGHEGQQGHAEPEVGHVVLPLGLGEAVSQCRLQGHKQHTGGEGDACSDIVENFGIIHLSYGEKRPGRHGGYNGSDKEYTEAALWQQALFKTWERSKRRRVGTSDSFRVKLISHCCAIL